MDFQYLDLPSMGQHEVKPYDECEVRTWEKKASVRHQAHFSECPRISPLWKFSRSPLVFPAVVQRPSEKD